MLHETERFYSSVPNENKKEQYILTATRDVQARDMFILTNTNSQWHICIFHYLMFLLSAWVIIETSGLVKKTVRDLSPPRSFLLCALIVKM